MTAARIGRVFIAVTMIGIAVALTAAARPSATAQARSEAGRELYVTGCSSCHGLDGEGVAAPSGAVRGPSLRASGAAAASYYLTTGRMPLANAEDPPARKEPAYTPAEIDALVAYVASLGDGPAVPDVDPARGDVAEGGVLYRTNCQACHSATGAGGALSYGRAAPPLGQASALQVATAMRVGPGQMPVFGPDALGSEDVDSIARYVEYLEKPDNRGGVSLGGLGPVPEGFLVWVLGIGGLLVVCVWVGKRAKARRAVGET